MLAFFKKSLTVLSCVFLYSCSALLPQSGPSTSAIRQEATEDFIHLVEPNAKAINFLKTSKEKDFLSNLKEFQAERFFPRLDIGDVVEVIIYEQPPAVLFAQASPLIQAGPSAFQVPAQQVDENGNINVPFAGFVNVRGKTPEDVSAEIYERLKRKANNPQVVVRVLDHRSAKVTIAGNVRESRSIPLSYNVYTLLDVISAVGGINAPVNKTIIKLNRKGKSIEIPFELLLKDPQLNLNLSPGDTITVVYKSQSASFLGATGKNEELEFEAMGITLAQALARVGGLRDDIAHAKGVFVFRLEKPENLAALGVQPRAITQDGRVPTVYNFDLSKGESFFLLREFELKDKDIVYVSTAPAVQLRKFLQTISDIITPIFQIRILTR